jgi:hypothetical protein
MTTALSVRLNDRLHAAALSTVELWLAYLRAVPHGGPSMSASADVHAAPHYRRIWLLLPALINYYYSRLAEYSSAQNVPP